MPEDNKPGETGQTEVTNKPAEMGNVTEMGNVATAPISESEMADTEILLTKTIRIELDKVLQDHIKTMKPSREIALCRTKVEEAIMWAGMNLKRLNDGKTCYENSYKLNTIVDPMKDGVKL